VLELPTSTFELGQFYPDAEADFAFVEFEFLVFAEFLQTTGTPVWSRIDNVRRRHSGSAEPRLDQIRLLSSK
jgi:hypothetical protein